jgi:tight adherence protein B
MEISEDIETLVTSTKMEQNIMLVMPIALISIIKMMSPEFAANFVTPTGIISTTISIVIFVVAYFIGTAVLEIKM